MLTNAPPPQMVLIPGGTFKMGDAFSGDGYPDELPAHNVNIDSFWISKTQVSREEWNEVANWATNRVPDSYQFDNTSSQFAMDRPSENISWYDAVKWCNAKSEKEGRSPVYFVPSGMLAFVYRAGQVDDVGIWTNANGYRLPTEAEWEYAARGGLRGRRFPYGDTISHQQACYYSINTYPYDISNTRGYFQGSSASVSVMAFAPNGYGLYNMSGNSRDFCWDRYVANYYSWGVTNNPHGPNGNAYPKRVTRGGASHFSAKENRTSFRHYSLPPDDVSLQLGFRTVIH
jgi:formylglycine-generating enzyme required for sulfatase activity